MASMTLVLQSIKNTLHDTKQANFINTSIPSQLLTYSCQVPVFMSICSSIECPYNCLPSSALGLLHIFASVHLSIRPSVHLSMCLSVYFPIGQLSHLTICLSVHMSICSIVNLQIRQSHDLSFSLFVCSSVCLPACLALALLVPSISTFAQGLSQAVFTSIATQWRQDLKQFINQLMIELYANYD